MEAFTAFGLRIDAGFPIPGARSAEGDAGLPRIAVELESPQQLNARWSGTESGAAWRGRLGDGQLLTVEWGRDGDLMFGYGERATFRLDATRDRLGCAPVDPEATAWRRVLLTRILPNVAIAHGYEALHASAVVTDLGVVAVPAPSGTGKSTLAQELDRRGWPLFADDSVVLGRGAGGVEAHPEVGDSAVGPGPVAAVVLLDRVPGMALRAWPLDPSPLPLAPFMLGLPDDEGRDRSRFELYADLVERCRVLRLTADVTDPPVELAETLEGALGIEAPILAGGVA